MRQTLFDFTPFNKDPKMNAKLSKVQNLLTWELIAKGVMVWVLSGVALGGAYPTFSIRWLVNQSPGVTSDIYLASFQTLSVLLALDIVVTNFVHRTTWLGRLFRRYHYILYLACSLVWMFATFALIKYQGLNWLGFLYVGLSVIFGLVSLIYFIQRKKSDQMTWD